MSVDTAYLIVDTESVPDGKLIASVKYPDAGLSPEAAIDRFREECREQSLSGSDFIPHTFQFPVAICVIRVRRDFALESIACLDAPHYRPDEIVRQFWKGYDHYDKAKLVTFNGRGFDIPLLELAAFRHGIPINRHIHRSRNRYNGGLDLQEFFTNYGATRFPGGLNLAAKILGLPGKIDCAGHEVLGLYRAGELQAINDYCLCDTLDTYFVFLRTRVLTEEITPAEESERIEQARVHLTEKAGERPAIRRYLEAWDAAR